MTPRSSEEMATNDYNGENEIVLVDYNSGRSTNYEADICLYIQ